MLKKIVKAFMPHGLVIWRQQIFQAQCRAKVEKARVAYHAERRARIRDVDESVSNSTTLAGDNYEDVIQFLMRRGLAEHQLREGSVPCASLEFIRHNVIAGFGDARPLRALHVGNFVGVSLAFLTASIVQQHPQSVVVSVDPNLTHRGIAQPQSHVLALLSACGLQSNSLVLAGYSGKKSVSNDAVIFEGYDPAKEFANEVACEEALRNLLELMPGSFDLIFLDGNHEAGYLLNEIKQVVPLLRPGGYVILDDVDAAWAEIREVFLKISTLGLKPVTADGRVGIAQFSPS